MKHLGLMKRVDGDDVKWLYCRSENMKTLETGSNLSTRLGGTKSAEATRDASPHTSVETVELMVMKHLKKVDRVAYIRFASVYKRSRNLKTFRN